MCCQKKAYFELCLHITCISYEPWQPFIGGCENLNLKQTRNTVRCIRDVEIVVSANRAQSRGLRCHTGHLCMPCMHRVLHWPRQNRPNDSNTARSLLTVTHSAIDSIRKWMSASWSTLYALAANASHRIPQYGSSKYEKLWINPMAIFGRRIRRRQRCLWRKKKKNVVFFMKIHCINWLIALTADYTFDSLNRSRTEWNEWNFYLWIFSGIEF